MQADAAAMFGEIVFREEQSGMEEESGSA